jgi:hypothetical protein
MSICLILPWSSVFFVSEMAPRLSPFITLGVAQLASSKFQPTLHPGHLLHAPGHRNILCLYGRHVILSLYMLIIIFPYRVYSLFSLSIWSSGVAIFLCCTDSLSTSVLYQSLRCKSYSYFVILQLLIFSSILLICLSVCLRVLDHPLYSTRQCHCTLSFTAPSNWSPSHHEDIARSRPACVTASPIIGVSVSEWREVTIAWVLGESVTDFISFISIFSHGPPGLPAPVYIYLDLDTSFLLVLRTIIRHSWQTCMPLCTRLRWFEPYIVDR